MFRERGASVFPLFLLILVLGLQGFGVEKGELKGWLRKGELGEAPRRVTGAYPLSDQANVGNWGKYELMWDEFEGEKIDAEKWNDCNPRWQGRPPAFFSKHNVRLRDGKLHLTMRKEAPPEKLKEKGYHTYSSAAVQSTTRALYGYFEIQAKPMKSHGSSSFWFYDNTPELWTEIDVFEIGGAAPGFEKKYNMNVHVFKTPQEKTHWSKHGEWIAATNLADDYHVYGLEWDEKKLTWYFDGVAVRWVANTHWHQPLTLNFDSETMPKWFGLPKDEDLPSTYSIEYVRAWKRNKAGVTPAPSTSPRGMRIENGWFVQNQKVIWGYAQHNGWWGGYRNSSNWIRQYKVRTALCRNAPGQVGPSLTEDLDRLTDAMVRYGYPGFEHNYGLWYDRRRDNHDTQRRTDGKAAAPFLEQPWARSGRGAAWDGLSKYDLTKFNSWYFDRLKEFASLCETKGTILFHNFHMQHALLETEAHYVDFPWRPVNCIQDTGMPDSLPAANAFYNVSHPERRSLHRRYIRKCLDELGDYANVIHLTGEEYTGSREFVEFWIDTILAWERQTGKQVKIGLAATKDVTDAILGDPVRGARIGTLCLSYWWYKSDGTLYAPLGGREIAGRYTGKWADQTSPESLYRQVREYRRRYPDKAIILHHKGDVDKMWSFLTAGGSMLIGRMQYPDSSPPKEAWAPPDTYIAPAESALIQPTYDFIGTHLSDALHRMAPADIVTNEDGPSWCLAKEGENYLVFALKGGRIELDLSSTPGVTYGVRWFDPRLGILKFAEPEVVKGGGTTSFTTPDRQSWVVWLSRNRRNSLFDDLQFQRGFLLKFPRSSYGRKTEAILDFGEAENQPVWHLGQWGTKFSLAAAKCQKQPNGDLVYENPGKKVLAGGARSEHRDLILEVRGKAEYGDKVRKAGESWPHLLVEQDASNIYPLTQLAKLDFHVLLKLLRFEDHMNKKEFDAGRHAAQFQMFFVVRNIDTKSKDYNNYFWFGVPFFDSRHDIPKSYKARDVGKDDATGKFIYAIDGREVNYLPLKMKKWVTIQKDLLGHIKQGLQEAGKRGYFTDTDPAHYAVVNMNLGWEIPGTYDAAVQVRGLQINAVLK